MTQPVSEEQGALACATHRDVVTYLRCGKCDKPICPRCLVQTPVGARCRECAQLRSLPQFRVSPRHYLRAAGASLGMGAVGGFVWALLPFGGFLSFMISAGLGYLIGEGVNRATNRRVDLGIKTIAALGVVLAFIVSRGGAAWLFALGYLIQGSIEPLGRLFIFSLQGLISNPFSLLAMALGIYMAVRRLG